MFCDSQEDTVQREDISVFDEAGNIRSIFNEPRHHSSGFLRGYQEATFRQSTFKDTPPALFSVVFPTTYITECAAPKIDL